MRLLWAGMLAASLPLAALAQQGPVLRESQPPDAAAAPASGQPAAPPGDQSGEPDDTVTAVPLPPPDASAPADQTDAGQRTVPNPHADPYAVPVPGAEQAAPADQTDAGQRMVPNPLDEPDAGQPPADQGAPTDQSNAGQRPVPNPLDEPNAGQPPANQGAPTDQSNAGQRMVPNPLDEPNAGQVAGAEKPAGAQGQARPGGWVRMGTATLQALDKVNARAETLVVKVGDASHFGSLNIAVRGCFVRPTDQPADAIAFLAIRDQRPDAPSFVGWMDRDDPSMSMLAHPLYDVRVEGCSP